VKATLGSDDGRRGRGDRHATDFQTAGDAVEAVVILDRAERNRDAPDRFP
jgi:hypothetical protein